MYVCVHTQQSDNQIERWWIMDGVTFGFETNIYIKKHVSNKPTTWNDVFSCPFLSLSNDHISYPHPKGCWVPMIFLVEPRTWYWLPVTMLLCWKSGSFFFPHEAVTKPKDWPNWVIMPAVLDQNWPHINFVCIPIGFPWDYHIYLRICQADTIQYPVLYFIISGLFSTFLPSSGTASWATISVRCTASRCESGTNRQPQSSLTLWHRWANDVSWPNWRPFLAVLLWKLGGCNKMDEMNCWIGELL